MALIRLGRNKVVARLEPAAIGDSERRFIQEYFESLDIRPGPHLAETLPFAGSDATAGVENELQTAVAGDRAAVDLPRSIERSDYYANLRERLERSPTARSASDLERFLQDNPDGIWENSQVRVPIAALSGFARETFLRDLRADKRNPGAGFRRDSERFVVREQGQTFLRMPVSYLLKLALADALGSCNMPASARETGRRLLAHFLNDNTSPEQTSSYIVPLRAEHGMGRAVARETAQRFLLTQLLAAYANRKLRLAEHGQECLVYFSALPPQRIRRLNTCVSDTYYRDLFMNPCLSGWDQGEAKRDYMHLCHEVLSRSRLNTAGRLREAGVIPRNLVVVPNVSDTSLANNGTHISLGSLRLGRRFAAEKRGGYRAGEKYTGDLAIKMAEHFLPLFVGTLSAAPQRLAFADFHPENALGFLPHQLETGDLRRIWKSWKKKASLAVLKRPLTPFGAPGFDRTLARVFGLAGDFVPDFRLLDYFVALPSTARSPGLDGRLGNAERLKADLAEQGVYHRGLTLYLPYRLREFGTMGYAGFEGRHYSVFESLTDDLGRAVELQQLITALAFKYMASGLFGHAAIPDDPATESERRQLFFAAAVGLPYCYIARDTRNRFLRRILERTRRVRPSKYYQGHLKVPLAEYRLALLQILEEDAADLVMQMGLSATLTDMKARLEDPAQGAAGRQTSAILAALGAGSPLDVPAEDFNRAAERYYRRDLRRRHMDEAFELFVREAVRMDASAHDRSELRAALHELLGEGSAVEFATRVKADALKGSLAVPRLLTLIQLLLLQIAHDQREAARFTAYDVENRDTEASVHRA